MMSNHLDILDEAATYALSLERMASDGQEDAERCMLIARCLRQLSGRYAAMKLRAEAAEKSLAEIRSSF